MSATRPLSRSLVRRKRVAKHRLSTFGLLACGFVLNDIPVPDQHAIFEANAACRDPVHRSAKAGESTVNDHEITFSHDYSRLILQHGRNAVDEIKEGRRDLAPYGRYAECTCATSGAQPPRSNVY